jgi:ABC-2 type transport system permease protein
VLRAIVIFSPALLFSLLGFFLSGGRASLAQLLLWVTVVVAYGAFWFALAIAVNALGKNAATNAVMLAACWLAFVVVIPSVINLLATTCGGRRNQGRRGELRLARTSRTTSARVHQ